MRVAHVTTLVADDGSSGGPPRVAFMQASALTRLGHEVQIFAAGDVREPTTTREDGGFLLTRFPRRTLIPKTGYAGLSAAGLLRELRRTVGTFDVAHIHMSRDLVTLPAARLFLARRVPVFLQPHGMIDRSNKALAHLLDAAATRSVLRRAEQVFALTEEEEDELRRIEPHTRVTPIANGMQVGALPDYQHRSDEVLFVSRLHPRKRAMAFVEMAETLAPRFPSVRFALLGPDEGDGEKVNRAISASRFQDQISWSGAVTPAVVDDRMSRARVMVLPSVGEVFPMAMLEAFAAGTPVVCTDSLGIAGDTEAYGAGLVTDGSVEALTSATASILDDFALASRLREGAHRYLTERLDISRVALQLQAAYLMTAR